MKTIKGPALFLAQFASDTAPFNSWDAITRWAADCGYVGVQVPSWDARLIDLAKAASSKDYCDEFKGMRPGQRRDGDGAVGAPSGPVGRRASGLRHRVRRLRCRPPSTAIRQRGRPGRCDQVRTGDRRVPQPRPVGAGHVLRRARLAVPLSVAAAAGGPRRDRVRRAGQALAPAARQGGRRTASTFATRSTPARTCTTAQATRCSSSASATTPAPTCCTTRRTTCLQALDYLANIDIYSERIRMFHVKDAEFNPTGRQGVYGGFQSWVDRAGRFRSVGDGQVDFTLGVLQAHRRRVRRLGGGRVGVLRQASRGRRARRRGLRPGSHHPRDRDRVRRFRERRHGRGRQPHDAGAATGAERAAAARHGRRRRGRLHRRGPPHRRTARRCISPWWRARCPPTPSAPGRVGRGARADRVPRLRRLCDHGRGGGGARR